MQANTTYKASLVDEGVNANALVHVPDAEAAVDSSSYQQGLMAWSRG